MTDHDACEYCVNPGNGIVRSALLPRSEALFLYARLQRQGHFPSMCENVDGKYHVCHSEARPVTTGMAGGGSQAKAPMLLGLLPDAVC